MRPSDFCPQELIEAIRATYKKDPQWITVQIPDPDKLELVIHVKNRHPMLAMTNNASDLLSFMAIGRWLVDGPKLFKATPEQCEAMNHVDVNILPREYTQPYPALMVVLPKEACPPFFAVLCYRDETIAVFVLFSHDHKDDITTAVNLQSDKLLEWAIEEFKHDAAYLRDVAAPALRIAANVCLALSHYGCHLDYLLPKEVESDRRLARESTPRGERARGRLPLAMQVANFNQEIKLHHSRIEGSGGEASEPSGRQMSPHWRRGHWRMQAHGEGKALRKRVFIAPVLVRADMFIGDKGDTTTVYK